MHPDTRKYNGAQSRNCAWLRSLPPCYFVLPEGYSAHTLSWRLTVPSRRAAALDPVSVPPL